MKKPAKKSLPKKTEAKQNATKNTIKTTVNTGIRKQYLKTRPQCKVTFRLPKEAAPKADLVCIAGDFNGWDTNSTHLKKLKSGDFTLTLPLEKNREYRFRYLINNDQWENDWNADKYIPNPFGCDDSVVIV